MPNTPRWTRAAIVSTLLVPIFAASAGAQSFAPAQSVGHAAQGDAPTLQVTAGGVVRALWTGPDAGRAVAAPDATAFGPVQRLRPLAALRRTAAAFAPDGGAWVVGKAGTTLRAQYVTPGGRVVRRSTLTCADGPVTGGLPVLTVNARGDALAAWAGVNGVCAALRLRGRDWRVVRVSRNTASAEPAVALTPSGAGAVAFVERSTVRLTALDARGRRSSPLVLGRLTIPGIASPRVALDDRGDALVTWADSLTAGGEFDFEPRPAGVHAAIVRDGQVRSSEVLDAAAARTGQQGAPAPALAPDGQAMVAWLGATGARVARGTIAAGLTVAPGTLGERARSLAAGLAPSGATAVIAFDDQATQATTGPFAAPDPLQAGSPPVRVSVAVGARRSAVGIVTYDNGIPVDHLLVALSATR
jgi:hypothetical protein